MDEQSGNATSLAASTEERAQVAPVPTWLAGHSPTPDSIARFCRDHRILDQLEIALAAVEKAFPGRDGLVIRLERDPETGNTYAVLKISAHEEPDSFLQAYDRCVHDWISSLRPEALDLICLAYRLH